VWRDGDRVRLFTRNGYDWTQRYPWIVHTARRLRATRFLIDGEVVVCGDDGVADFARLHSQAHDVSAFLYGFDLLSVDGTDIRRERLADRRTKLRTVLARPDGIRFSEDLDGDGEIMFRHACKLGLEGIVCKRRDSTYRSGRDQWRAVLAAFTRNPQARAWCALAAGSSGADARPNWTERPSRPSPTGAQWQ
jgi:bifunctional non-homologous end joining protein LigD